MRKAYLVMMPAGTGKTRWVWSKIFNGCKKCQKTIRQRINSRLRKTVILTPSKEIKLIWLRELLLWALDENLLCRGDLERTKNFLSPKNRHRLTLKKLREIFRVNKIDSPKFFSFRSIPRTRLKKRIQYLVVDEWHHLTNQIKNQCANWPINQKAWYLEKSRNRGPKPSLPLSDIVFFVSATPLNPVLENEGKKDVVEDNALEFSEFKERIKQAKIEDYQIIAAFTGQVATFDLDEPFLQAIRRRRITVVKEPERKKSLQWHLARPAKWLPETELPPTEVSVIKKSGNVQMCWHGDVSA